MIKVLIIVVAVLALAAATGNLRVEDHHAVVNGFAILVTPRSGIVIAV